MPIYEFICQDCRARFECFFRTRQDIQPVVCNLCGSKRIERIYSTFGLGGGKDSAGSSSSSCGACSTKTCSTCR